MIHDGRTGSKRGRALVWGGEVWYDPSVRAEDSDPPARSDLREATSDGAASTGGAVPFERAWVAAFLVVALLLRLPGLDDPWSGKGFNSALGSFGTAEFVQNAAQHGFWESGGMPYRWRVELADGTVEREWYAHHPVAFYVLTWVSRTAFGAGELAIRLPWLLLSLLLPWAAWRSLRRLFGGRVALGALAALVAPPLAAHYALMPWVDNGVLAAAMLAVTARFTLWLEEGESRELRAAVGWMSVASFLDWTAALLLPCLGLAALAVARRRGPRLLGLAALLPAAVGLSAAVHAAHMLAVIGWDELWHDFTTTWSRTRTARVDWLEFTRGQARALSTNLGWPTLTLAGLGAGVLSRRSTARGVRRWAVVALLVPGALYVYLFPFRGTNHDFMWIQSAGGVAALVGLALAALSRVRHGGLVAGAAAVALVAHGAHATLERHRATRSAVVRLAADHETLAPILGSPGDVVVTAMGQGWTLMPYATTPVIPRVEEVAELERLRERVLSQLGPGRRVHFLFDVQFHKVHAELLEHLRASGPSVQVLDGLRADPTVAFEVFDLTDWARRP